MLFRSRILKYFDYVTVPVNSAVEKFDRIKKEKKISVIPQGFDYRDIIIKKYKKNEIPTFGYAGSFYKGVRNPILLMEFLVSLEIDFRFYIYTNIKYKESFDLVNKYKMKLKEKLIIMDSLERVDCIERLSTFDFLINIDNLGAGQNPSKIIDYILVKRPIFNMRQDSFDDNVFKKFLEGDYTGKYNPGINIEDYNIVNVAKSFLNLK